MKIKLPIIISLIIASIILTFLLSYRAGLQQCSAPLPNEPDNLTESKEKHKLILLISIDGLGSSSINKSDAPFIYSLLGDDNYTFEAKTLEQSVTLPSHTSMLTGLNQENHGVTFNGLNDETPKFTLQSLDDFAEQADYKFSALVTKDKLLYIFHSDDEQIKSAEKFSSEIMDQIDDMLEPNNYNQLGVIHFRDLDSTGHKYGWDSQEYKDNIEVLDKNLEELITDTSQEFDGYERYYIITADHGGEGKQHGNGCDDCRRIPIIVKSENTQIEYLLDRYHNYKVFDNACIVLDIMNYTPESKLDCYRSMN